MSVRWKSKMYVSYDSISKILYWNTRGCCAMVLICEFCFSYWTISILRKEIVLTHFSLPASRIKYLACSICWVFDVSWRSCFLCFERGFKGRPSNRFWGMIASVELGQRLPQLLQAFLFSNTLSFNNLYRQ